MDLPTLTATRLWEATSGLLLLLWGIYKKELQDWFKACGKRLYARFVLPDVARRVTDAELKAILASGMAGLKTMLLVLLKEYEADRVTVMEYRTGKDGHTATCVAEVRSADMPSIEYLFQNTPLPAGLWTAFEHIHAQAGRWALG